MRSGTGALDLDLPEAQRIVVHRPAPVAPIADVPAAVRNALEHPVNYPALRQALTPDDHVAVVVDEGLRDLPRVLTPLLEHLAGAQITPDAVTLLCAESSTAHTWVDRLPAAFHQVKVEEHDPHNRKKLSYLATTKQGRRVYLNRTAVDADQLVVLSRRVYDPLLGHGGSEGAIFPALSDAETQKATLDKLSMEPADAVSWPVRQEAAEVSWLLGAPFFVQIIQGPGDEVAHVLGGPIATSAEGQHLLDARCRIELDKPADTIIAQVSGEPARHTFADLARALACASRVVRPGGRIVLVSGGKPDLGAGGQLLRQADSPDEALALLKERQPLDRAAAFQWSQAARRASLYVLSELPAELVEELFATPLEEEGQVRRLVGNGAFLYLADADKTLAVLR